MMMISLYDYFSAILVDLYDSQVIPEDLYQYGAYVLALIIPIIALTFCLACTYKLLSSILEGVKQ